MQDLILIYFFDLEVENLILDEGSRLDHLAAQNYGDGSYWWVIAAASSIGWGLQVPAGTIISIPSDINQVLSLVV